MKKVAQADQVQLREAVSEHLKTAEKFLKAGEMDKAMKRVEDAIALDPKNAYAHAYKDRILDLQREKGKKEAEQIEQEQPKVAEGTERERREAEEKRLREEEETRLRADEEARKHRAEEQQKRKEKQLRLEKHLSRASTYLEEGKFEKALDETEKALQLDPNNRDAIKLDTKIHQEKLEEEKRVEEEARRKAEEEEERRRREEEERERREAEEAEHRAAMEKVDQHLAAARDLLDGEEFEKALEEAEEALQLNPRHEPSIQLEEEIRKTKLEVKLRKADEELGRKERILELEREKVEKESLQLEQERRKLAEEAKRNRLEVRKRRTEEEQERKEKQQRLKKHLSQARKYLKEGRFEKALDKTEKALQLDPNNPGAVELDTKIHQEKLERQGRAEEEAWRRREEEERKRREAEEAERRAAMRKIDQHLAAARDLLDREEFEKALEEAEKALQLNPRHEPSIQLEEEIRKHKVEEEKRQQARLKKIEGHVQAAEEYLQKQKFERARGEVKRVYEIDSENADARRLELRIKEAEEARRRAEEEERRQVRLKKIQGHLQAVEEYLQKQKFESALDEVKRIYEIDPEYADARELERWIKEAGEARRRAEEEERRQAQLKKIQEQLQAAEDYLQKQKFERALDEVKRIYEVDSQHADARELEQRIKQEEEDFRRVQEEAEKKRKIETILQKTRGYVEGGKYQKAIDEAARVYQTDSENAEARALEETARRVLEEEERARRKAEEEAAREAEKKKKTEELLTEADGQFLNGEYGKALSSVSTLLTIDPGSPEATELMEVVQKAKKEVKRAAAEGVAVVEEKKVEVRKRVARRRRKRRRPYVLIGSAAAITIALVIALNLGETPFVPSPSLFVVPLENASGNSRDDYIVDGLTAAFVSDFGIIADLKTYGPATSLKYKNTSKELASVGKELGVSYLISGTAKRSGDMVEVFIEMRDTNRGERVWRKRYSASLTDLHTIREDVFTDVTQMLNIDPLQVPRPLVGRWSDVPQAVDLYLQAEDRLRRRTEGSLRSAIRLFDRALARDSKFAYATAGKAYALALLYDREWEDDPATLERASRLANHAIALDPNILQAYWALGSVNRQRRSYAAAVERLQKALSLNPHDVVSLVELALVYGMQGDVSRGIDAASKAVEFDPKNFEAHLALALVHHLARNYKLAVASYDWVVSLRPDNPWDLLGLYDGALIDHLARERAKKFYIRFRENNPNDYTVIYRLARSYQLAGQHEASFRHFNTVISLARQELKRVPRSARAYMYIGLAQTCLGKFKEGVDAATKASSLAPEDYTILYNMAGLYSIQKKTEESLRWFRNAVQKRYSFKGILDHDLYNIRDEAEFLQISRNP